MLIMFKRIWIIFSARNKEFFRDKSALAWNIVFPFLVIAGFSLIFSDERQSVYKVGILPPINKNAAYVTKELRKEQPGSPTHTNSPVTIDKQYNEFRKSRYIEFIKLNSFNTAINKLKHHKLDLLISPSDGRYWVSNSSPNGYIAEKILIASTVKADFSFKKEIIEGKEIPFVEWLFPGILGMNMMFSALFGVGYVVVRYRKNGVLKRMSVTPLKPYEFLTAQIFSRMFLILTTTAFVYAVCVFIYGFECRGSYLSLFLIFTLGGFCMVSMGLLVAARSSSEEFAGGILNLITWPMMFLSEVWFSLEGAHPWVISFSKIFPLTHMIDGARKIMNDGMGLMDIKNHIIVLTVMSVCFLFIGSILFRWQKPN